MDNRLFHSNVMPDEQEMGEMYQNRMPMSNQMPGMLLSQSGNCIPQETILRNVKLAHAYVPFQKLCTTLSPMEGLKKGTIFPELFSPYEKEKKRCK